MKKFNISNSLQNEWDYFLEHFTENYILNEMTKEDYVVGAVKTERSFCYMVETVLRDLGSINGPTSSKFGLYYGKNGKDTEFRFRPSKSMFSDDVEKCFQMIKEDISNLIMKTKQLADFKDIPSKFGPYMFKYKIMYLYNPNIMVPIFKKDDLYYFAQKLNIKCSNNYEQLQKQLIKYKQNHFNSETNHWFMNYLYNEFGRPIDKETIKVNERADDDLNKNIKVSKKKDYSYIAHPVPRSKLKTIDGVKIYPRDKNASETALFQSGFNCEYDCDHKSFIRRKDGTKYLEVHHLIPLCFYDDFSENSLDVPANIVCLCSECHNLIHYGKDSNVIIEKLYNDRKDKLKEAGIEVSLDELLTMYRTCNNKE